MNYRYKLFNDVFILSEEEHKNVQEAMTSGKDLIRLRNNSLILNMKHITSVTETDTLVNENKQNVLKIEAPKFNQERINQKLDEMKRVLWEKWGLTNR